MSAKQPGIPCRDPVDRGGHRDYFGITMRDYFAAAALPGIIASRGASSVHQIAESAYRYADAMLKARG